MKHRVAWVLLAALCAWQGNGEAWAQALPRVRVGNRESAFETRDEKARKELTNIVQRFIDKNVTVAQLLESCEAFLQEYPQGVYAAEATRLRDGLKRAVEEQTGVAKTEQISKVSDKEFVDDRINGLSMTGFNILQKTEDIAQQMNYDPASIDRIWPNPLKEVSIRGMEMFPYLIEARGDTRLTRYINNSGGPQEMPRVMSVGDVVEIAAMQVARRSFNSAGEGTSQEQMSLWWTAVTEKGLRQVASSTVESGRNNATSQALLLAERFPQEALEAIKKGYANSGERWGAQAFLPALQLLPIAQVDAWLTDEMKNSPAPKLRVKCARTLWALGHDRQELIDAMVHEWKNLENADDKNSNMNAVIEFLIGVRTPEAVSALAHGLDRHSANTKFWVMHLSGEPLDPINYSKLSTPEEKERMAAISRAREALLVGLLKDDSRVGDNDFGVSEYTLKIPRVGDIAAARLAQIFPTKYTFNGRVTVAERDIARNQILNAWRREMGLPAVALAERKSAISEADEKLLQRAMTSENEADRTQALRALKAKGLPLLPGVESALVTSSENSPGRAELDRVAQAMANTVRSIEVHEEYGKLDARTRTALEGLKGRRLTGEALAGVLRTSAMRVPLDRYVISVKVEGDTRQAGLHVWVRVWERSGPVLRYRIGCQTTVNGKTVDASKNLSLVSGAEILPYERFIKMVDDALSAPRNVPVFILTSSGVMMPVAMNAEIRPLYSSTKPSIK